MCVSMLCPAQAKRPLHSAHSNGTKHMRFSLHITVLLLTKPSNGFREGGSEYIKVYTYHSLFSSITRQVINDELSFSEMLVKLQDPVFVASLPPWKHRFFTRLVIDESQDMRGYYLFILQFLLEHISPDGSKVLRMLVGHNRQLLYYFYAFNNADVRFMKFAHELLPSPAPWTTCSLTRSMRLTPQMASFVNLFPSTDPPIIGANPSGGTTTPVVSFYVCDVYRDLSLVIEPHVRHYLPDHTMILCPEYKLTITLSAMCEHDLIFSQSITHPRRTLWGSKRVGLTFDCEHIQTYSSQNLSRSKRT